jgi:hypothetical protein
LCKNLCYNWRDNCRIEKGLWRIQRAEDILKREKLQKKDTKDSTNFGFMGVFKFRKVFLEISRGRYSVLLLLLGLSLFLLACAPKPFTHFSGAKVNQGSNFILSYEGYNPALYLYPVKDNYFRTKTISFGYGFGEVSKSRLLGKSSSEKVTQEVGFYSTLLFPHPKTNMPISETWESQDPAASLLLDILTNYSIYVKYNISDQGQFLSFYMSYAPILDFQGSVFFGAGESPFSVYFGGTYWSQIFIEMLNHGGRGFSLTAGSESLLPNKKLKMGFECNFVKRFYDSKDEGKIKSSFLNFGINLGYRIK